MIEAELKPTDFSVSRYTAWTSYDLYPLVNPTWRHWGGIFLKLCKNRLYPAVINLKISQTTWTNVGILSLKISRHPVEGIWKTFWSSPKTSKNLSQIVWFSPDKFWEKSFSDISEKYLKLSLTNKIYEPSANKYRITLDIFLNKFSRLQAKFRIVLSQNMMLFGLSPAKFWDPKNFWTKAKRIWNNAIEIFGPYKVWVTYNWTEEIASQ